MIVNLIAFALIFSVARAFGILAAVLFFVSWWYLGAYATPFIERPEFHRRGQAHFVGIPAVLGFLYLVFQSSN
jgi:hypothetical protein